MAHLRHAAMPEFMSALEAKRAYENLGPRLWCMT